MSEPQHVSRHCNPTLQVRNLSQQMTWCAQGCRPGGGQQPIQVHVFLPTSASLSLRWEDPEWTVTFGEQMNP